MEVLPVAPLQRLLFDHLIVLRFHAQVPYLTDGVFIWKEEYRRHTADVSVLALSWYHVLAHTRREVLESPHTAENAGIV